MAELKTKIETGWSFDNSYARLPKVFYTKLNPQPVPAPKLLFLNESLAGSLGLNGSVLKGDEGAAVFGGNQLPAGALPLAQAYAGHQFGHFTMLGDGRAILLGEQKTPQGERFDIQLKGSGRTPYSRGGDGRAALGPMLREYIISEAMFGLSIPTTRSLAVIATGETVRRQTSQPGAILTRVAASHLRVGTFQFAARWSTPQELKILADYTLERHFPDYYQENQPYLYLMQEVIKRQATLIAKWQLIGFVHGVMNTDNMAISGETIDYGPCAFLDRYNPAAVFSSIDTHGRYAYGNQPPIAIWNLARFADALLPLLHEDEKEAVKIAEEALNDFNVIFNSNWLAGMRAKLGIFNEEPEDRLLSEDLLKLMHKYRADYTNTFRALTLAERPEADLDNSTGFRSWQQRWQARLSRQLQGPGQYKQLMRQANPGVIPRNQRVEEALEAAVNGGDYSVMQRLLNVLACPFSYSSEQEQYTALPGEAQEVYRTFCGT